MKYKSKKLLALLLCISLILPYTSEICQAVSYEADEKKEAVTTDTNVVISPYVISDTVNGSVYIKKTDASDASGSSSSNGTIEGASNAKKGDIIKLGGISNTSNYKPDQLTWEIAGTENGVAASDIAKISKDGTLTVVGPGTITLAYTYSYQVLGSETKKYTTQVTEADGTPSTDENGKNVTTEVTTEVTTYDNKTVSGAISLTIDLQILSTTNRMVTNNTLQIQTNVPATSKKNVTFGWVDENTPNVVFDKSTTVSDGYITGLLRSNNKTGSVRIFAKMEGCNDSAPFEVTVVNDFTMSQEKLTVNKFNYVPVAGSSDYKKKNTEFQLETLTSKTNDVTWFWGDPKNGGVEIKGGNSPANAVLNENGIKVYFEKSANTNQKIAHFEITENYQMRKAVQSLRIFAAQEPDRESNTSCTVTINKPVDPSLFKVAVYTDKEVDPTSQVETYEGDSINVVATLLAENKEIPGNTNISFNSANSSVIAVGEKTAYSSEGTVSCSFTALSAGICSITVTSEDGGYSIPINFIVRPLVTSVTLNPASVSIPFDEANNKLQVKASVSCGDAYKDNFIDKRVKWETSSDNENNEIVADVYETETETAVVTLYRPGRATVTATALGKTRIENEFTGDREIVKGVCVVTVLRLATDIRLSNTPTDLLSVGEQRRIGYTIFPDNASVNASDFVGQRVLWYSSNDSIVSVDEDGLITAKAPGSATIRAIVNDTSGVYKTFNVTVKQTDLGITLNHEELKISRGTSKNLIATIFPDNTTDKMITWTSSDSSIASVSYSNNAANSNKCVVTGLAVGGPIYITAQTVSGRTVRCKVTVTEPVTGIKISPKTKTVWVGHPFTIKKTIYPVGKSVNTDVNWTSSRPSVAKVDANGKVTPLAGGKTVITAKTADGGFTARCTVTVKEKVSSISLGKKNIYIQVGKTYQLKPKVKRSTATNKKVSFKTSNSKIVTVSQTGKLKAKKTGVAKVTCTAKDKSGVKAVVKVHVIRMVKKLKLNHYDMKGITGEIYRLKATVLPKNATQKAISWSSSDKSIATVTKNGKIYALKAGTCYITAKTTDGSNLKKKCRLTIIDPIPVENIGLSKQNITLVRGQGTQLESRVYPTNATSAIRWMTDDETIAKVSPSGYVKATGVGTTTITAYSKEGVEAQCVVEVIAINQTQIAIEQFDKYTLYVDGASSGITWVSSNSNIATISPNGEVFAVKPGTAVMTATYNGKKVSCKVTVKRLN